MQIIMLPRRGGKTVRAVGWLREDESRILVVPNVHMKRILLDAHADLIGRVFYARELSEKLNPLRGGRRVSAIGIDELTLVMQELLGGTVSFATDTIYYKEEDTNG